MTVLILAHLLFATLDAGNIGQLMLPKDCEKRIMAGSSMTIYTWSVNEGDDCCDGEAVAPSGYMETWLLSDAGTYVFDSSTYLGPTVAQEAGCP